MMQREKAIALSYDPTESAPRIVASGERLQAERILLLAAEHGIPVVSSPILADILGEQAIGAFVPDDTFETVAAVFAFLRDGIERDWL